MGNSMTDNEEYQNWLEESQYFVYLTIMQQHRPILQVLPKKRYWELVWGRERNNVVSQLIAEAWGLA